MSVNEIILLAAIGLIGGILGGMTGLGGGVIIIPMLVYFMGMSQQTAQGTNLFMMLPPIGIMATYSYYKAGYVDIKFAIILMIAFIAGSYLSSLFAVSIPEKMMRKIFGVMLLAISIKMIFWK